MLIKRDANELMRELECILETRLQEQAEDGGLDYAKALDMIKMLEYSLSVGSVSVLLDDEDIDWLVDIYDGEYLV